MKSVNTEVAPLPHYFFVALAAILGPPKYIVLFFCIYSLLLLLLIINNFLINLFQYILLIQLFIDLVLNIIYHEATHLNEQGLMPFTVWLKPTQTP